MWPTASAGEVCWFMSEQIPELVALIQAHRRRLEAVYRSMETIFVRISQSFENNLDPARWHNDLLQKMTLEIEGVRPAAVSEETYSPLFELLKFRHFKRYYFELEYDWDRLDFLVTKLHQVHPLVTRDLKRFVRFVSALDQC